MSGRIQLLATLLGLQLLVIAGFLYFDVAGSSEAAPSLLQFTVDDVDRVVISGGDDEIELTRNDSGWQLPNATPADGDKLSEVLNKLSSLSSPWPVATSESSRERFEVTADSFQRHIQLFAKDALVADLYLGTSPGFRRVHARAADAEEVYSIDFSNYEVPTNTNDWLDKDLLQAVGDVTQVTREGEWTLRKNDEGWLLQGSAAAEEGQESSAADPEAADKVVERIAQLRVTGMAEEDANLAEQATFVVTDGSGDQQLRIFHDAEGDKYAVESDRVAGRFAVASYIAEQFLVGIQDLQPGADDEAMAKAESSVETQAE